MRPNISLLDQVPKLGADFFSCRIKSTLLQKQKHVGAVKKGIWTVVYWFAAIVMQMRETDSTLNIQHSLNVHRRL